MPMSVRPTAIELNEEEAYALLALALTSPNALDATSEQALRKLAAFCSAAGTKRIVRREAPGPPAQDRLA